MELLTTLKNKLNALFSNPPRAWPILLAAGLVFWFILPGFSVATAAKFVTFFGVAAALGWAALRVLWIERTSEIENDDRQKTRAVARDIAYAFVIGASLIAAATLSL